MIDDWGTLDLSQAEQAKARCRPRTSRIEGSSDSRGHKVLEADTVYARRTHRRDRSRQVTAGHSRSQQVAAGHSRSRQVTAGHGRSRQVAADHGRSQQVATGRDRSRQVTADHGRSRQVAVDHGRSRQVATGRSRLRQDFKIHVFMNQFYSYHSSVYAVSGAGHRSQHTRSMATGSVEEAENTLRRLASAPRIRVYPSHRRLP